MVCTLLQFCWTLCRWYCGVVQ